MNQPALAPACSLRTPFGPQLPQHVILLSSFILLYTSPSASLPFPGHEPDPPVPQFPHLFHEAHQAATHGTAGSIQCAHSQEAGGRVPGTEEGLTLSVASACHLVDETRGVLLKHWLPTGGRRQRGSSD